MAAKCQFFYYLRDKGLIDKAKGWLKKSPPPASWKHSAWRWAYENMPMDTQEVSA